MKRHTSKRWNILPGDIQAEARLQIELGVHPIVARLLVQRGIVTPEAADRFLNPTLDRLHDPFLLPDALPACERIKQALAQNEKILVHGDYDGDGVTSAALWTRVLRSLGADADVFVPNRSDGYDMRMPFIEDAKSRGAKLIITTDCGIQRVDEVERARHAGIDVIITDHHKPNTSGELPRAVAVVNPHRKDSRYPFPDIAGVVVAFKMGEALTRHLGHNPNKYRKAFLDLAAIGTITDVMPLIDENRIIVKHGLEALQNTKKPGLRALRDVCGYRDKVLDTYTVSHGMGPRLNAASRMAETEAALNILLTKDEAEGQRLASKLNEYNIQRKDELSRIFEEAMEQVVRQDMAEAKCLVLSSANWTGGIVGLVASKMAERFHRPCIVISMNEATGIGRGSARSILGFNILDAIDACRDLLSEYGGHVYAAGLSIAHDNVPDFSAQMNRIAGSLLQDEDLLPTLDVAAEIAPGEICHQLLHQIETLAPFGCCNHEPLFVSRSVPIVEVNRMGAEKQHLNLTLRADGVNRFDSVRCPWFSRGELAEGLDVGMSLDVCYKPQFNHWNGHTNIQFMIEDISPPEW
jgi:single-stranded-DNA-specific exonuclease